jgi:transcriptional regulator with XRE-family HTH domain
VKPQDPGRLLRDLGRRLAELRIEHNLTQEQLAEQLDVTARYVQAVEAGQENLTVRSLATLASALGVGVAQLFAAPKSRIVRQGRPPRRR